MVVIWLQSKPAVLPCFSERLWAHYQLPTLFQCHEGNDLPKARVAIFEVAQLMRYGKMSWKTATKPYGILVNTEYIPANNRCLRPYAVATDEILAFGHQTLFRHVAAKWADEHLWIGSAGYSHRTRSSCNMYSKSIAAFYLHLPHKAPKCRQNVLYIECLGMKYLDHIAIRIFIQVRLPKQTEIALLCQGPVYISPIWTMHFFQY